MNGVDLFASLCLCDESRAGYISTLDAVAETRLWMMYGIKMKAAIAIKRKLFEIIYTDYKTGVTYV